MKTKNGFLIGCLAMLLAACHKNGTTPELPSGSITIRQLATADTLVKAVPVTGDSTITIGFNAMLKGGPATAVHNVRFSVDTNMITAYRAKYGSASVLPGSAYFFYRADCRIPAGASVSDTGQINIYNEASSLDGSTIYVLPVIITSVDGNPTAVAGGQVLFLVLKTGKPASISKRSWKIISYSSESNDGLLFTGAVSNLLDNNLNTYWLSDPTQTMPQNFVIDFGKPQPFSAISYTDLSTILLFGSPVNNVGAYPTSIKIELSSDDINWTNEGTFNEPDPPISSTQTIPVSNSTARYMRFTILAAAPFFLTGTPAVILADVSLIP